MSEMATRQSGMALIASLLVLILVTLGAVATMESTGMQLKMANAGMDREQAFEAAEAGLRLIEEAVDSNAGGISSLTNMYLTCSGSNCYAVDCPGGRCFQGIWRSDEHVTQCKALDDASNPTVEPPATSPWETGAGSDYLNVWDDPTKHMTISVAPYKNPVQYIIEFRCFAAADPGTLLSDTNAAQIFRITTRAMSDSGRAEVMLQSSYKRTDLDETVSASGGSGGSGTGGSKN